MAEYTFYFNPMSRAQIARWALHEADAEYDAVFVDWADKPAGLLEANPLGKLPTIVHHHRGHDHVVTEAAAICHYLAEMSAPELLPRDEEKADYFRYLLFAAGPLEQASVSNSLGWKPDDAQKGMVGFGSYDRAVDALESMFEGRDHVCGERFTMADVYVGSQIDWGLHFKSLPSRPVFESYAERIREREAYKAAKAIDIAMIEEMQK